MTINSPIFIRGVGTAAPENCYAQGECWGNDDSGKEFAKDYVPGSQGAVEGFTNLVQGLRGMQQNVAKSMQALSGADQDVTSQLGKGQ